MNIKRSAHSKYGVLPLHFIGKKNNNILLWLASQSTTAAGEEAGLWPLHQLTKTSQLQLTCMIDYQKQQGLLHWSPGHTKYFAAWGVIQAMFVTNVKDFIFTDQETPKSSQAKCGGNSPQNLTKRAKVEDLFNLKTCLTCNYEILDHTIQFPSHFFYFSPCNVTVQLTLLVVVLLKFSRRCTVPAPLIGHWTRIYKWEVWLLSEEQQTCCRDAFCYLEHITDAFSLHLRE